MEQSSRNQLVKSQKTLYTSKHTKQTARFRFTDKKTEKEAVCILFSIPWPTHDQAKHNGRSIWRENKLEESKQGRRDIFTVSYPFLQFPCNCPTSTSSPMVYTQYRVHHFCNVKFRVKGLSEAKSKFITFSASKMS